MFGGQQIDRRRECSLGFARGVELRRDGLICLRDGLGFAPGAASIAAKKIERDGSDGGEKKSPVFNRMLFAPEADESFLDDVFGISDRTHELPGKENKSRCSFGETNFPIIMSSDIFHDLVTVFAIETPPTDVFVYLGGNFFLAVAAVYDRRFCGVRAGRDHEKLTGAGRRSNVETPSKPAFV